MIVIDIAEKPYVFEMFDRLKIPYKKEELRFPTKCEKVPLRWATGELTCIDKETHEFMEELKPTTVYSYERDTMTCNECDNRSMRVGDFTNEKRSFIAERKRVDDFYSSMADGRLYDQGRKMYKWFDGLKILILEGMGGRQIFEDSFNPFDKIDEEERKQQPKSPIQQLLELKPDKKEWIWSMIADLASCGVAIVQSWDLEETVKIINEIADGSGHEPKVRSIPKKVSGLSLEQQILCVIPGIGKGRSQNIIAEYGTLGKMISAIRKMKKTEANKRSMTKKLKEVFG